MLFTKALLLLSAAAAVSAAPTPEEVALVTNNRVHQVAAGQKLPGPLALAAAYAKYNKTLPTRTHKAKAALQSGSINATNGPYDSEYLAQVTVGTQKFKLQFDTGSADLWVFSTKQPAAQRGSHVLYNLGGKLQSGQTWDITYQDGDGSKGIVYADKVVVGAVTATTQAVEAATSASSGLVSGTADGLLGLSFGNGNTCSPNLCKTFMDTVGSTLPQNLFTATLRKGAPGTYDFGFIDSTKYTGTISYVNVPTGADQADWLFTATGYAINKGAQVTKNLNSIADTGTSLALIDTAVVKAFYANVPNAYYDDDEGGWIFPCSSASKLPSLTFYIGGQPRIMPGSYANYSPLDQGYCYGGVQQNDGLGFQLLGDVFLKSQFVVFNVGKRQLGFAQQKGVAV